MLFKKYVIKQGYLECCIKRNPKVMRITFMLIKPKFRGVGNGTKLLLKALKEAYLNHNVKTVTLDDMSNNYRKENNIYLKVGLKYDADWGPEMTGDIEEILITNNML